MTKKLFRIMRRKQRRIMRLRCRIWECSIMAWEEKLSLVNSSKLTLPTIATSTPYANNTYTFVSNKYLFFLHSCFYTQSRTETSVKMLLKSITVKPPNKGLLELWRKNKGCFWFISSLISHITYHSICYRNMV